MFQLRDADPWANTAPEPTESSATVDSIKSAVGGVFSFLTTPIGAAKDAASGGSVTVQPQAQPGQQTKVTTPLPKPNLATAWYKTPIGIAGIIAGAFVGWRYYKKRKAA